MLGRYTCSTYNSSRDYIGSGAVELRRDVKFLRCQLDLFLFNGAKLCFNLAQLVIVIDKGGVFQ